MNLRSSLVFAALIGVFAICSDHICHADETTVSPSGIYRATLSIDGQGRATAAVARNGKPLILPSQIGIVFADKDGKEIASTQWQTIVKRESGSSNSTWEPVWGERAQVRDRYNSLIVEYQSTEATDTQRNRMRVEIRAYDEGVAYRYLLNHEGAAKQGEDGEPIRIARELTSFRFADDHDVWAVTSAQGVYSKVPLSELKHNVERPCVLESKDGPVIAIAEAALVDYARMRLRRSSDEPNTLIAKLHNEDKSTPATLTRGPQLATPWRVVMAGESAAEILQNNDLILNLNEPCKIADTRWVKPGKVIRETSLSTEGAKSCVDFCVKYGLQFIEFDAGWYGKENDTNSDARTVSRRGLDLPEAIRYAKEHDIGVILYVNRRHLESQLDDLLPLYREWGISGIKYGFVQHGSQKWTSWMHEAIRKTADAKLMVDVHDEYRMTGWQRTYPNLMTAEGIGGDETRPTNEQALANLFTRMIVAPADHTFQYYKGYCDETTSHASQLAKSVCFFSPWQFLFWYDRPSAASGDEPELQFFKHLPTTWDDSRVLNGKIGEYATIARRSGDDWFVGCLNAKEPRSLPVALEFLPMGRKFKAHIYRDDANVPTKTKVGVEVRDVTSTDTIVAEMSPKGGVAIRLVAE